MNRSAHLSIVIVAALLLSACAPTVRRTLILWHSLDGVRERALLKLIDRWNADATHAVVVVPQRRSAPVQHAAFMAGQTPDIAVVSAAQAATYAERGVLRPLDDLVQGPEGFDAPDRADLFPFVFAVGKAADGRLVGLPLGGDLRLMFVNLDWFTERGITPPADGPALGRVCEQAVQEGMCFVVRQDDMLLQEWLHLNDVPLLSVDRTPMLRSERALQVLNELIEATRSGRAMTAVSDAQALNEFAAGRAVLMFEWSSRLRALSPLVAAGAGHEWDVAPIPAANRQSAGIVRAPLLVLPRSNAEREAEAWRFVRWMLSTAQTSSWAEGTDEIPARLSAVTVIDPGVAPPQFGSAVQRAGSSARAEPMLATWPCVIDGLDRSMLQLVNSQSITDSLEAAQQEMTGRLAGPCALR